jgi:sarcosine oxidase
MHWFPLKDPGAYSPERFPVFIWHHGSGVGDYFYGFPCLPGDVSMKMATEQCDVDTTADEVDRRVDAVESDEFYERHVKRRLGGVSSRAVRSVACMYTVTPDGGFVVEETFPGLIVASACSGHGFKHSAGLGEALADRACGGGSGSSASAALLDPFSAGRFRRGGGETSAGDNVFCSGLGRR